MIHDEVGEAAFAAIEQLLDGLGPVSAYRDLFTTALEAVKNSARQSPVFLSVDLPAVACDLLGQEEDLAVLAAAASTLVWCGADLMDDAADGQLASRWEGTSGHQIALVATNLLSVLPHLLVTRSLGEGPEAAAYAQALSRTLFSMSEGQWTDLEGPAQVDSTEAYLGVIRRKSGAEFAFFASTPAILSGAGPEAVSGWVRFGMAYGTMVQAFSDTLSVVAEGPRNDLLGGKMALPVFLTLEKLSETDHAAALADLDMARQGDHTAVVRVVEAMRRTGGLREGLQRCELLRYRSAEALPAPLADLPMNHPVRTLLRVYSMV